MGAARLNDLIGYTFGQQLVPAGFQPVRPRRWVRGVKHLIREIFEVQPLKGFTYSARWGFSMDFVPLYRAEKFRWKRTAKSAAFDICLDPIDWSGYTPQWCSFQHFDGLHEVKPSELAAVAVSSVQAARIDFGRVDSIVDLVNLFNERAAARYRRFSPDNYIQTDLAWGLALYALGRDLEAEQRITLFCNRFDARPDDPLLQRAIATAKQIRAASSA